MQGQRPRGSGWGSWLAATVILAGVIPVGGCRICADCEDLAYPAYGGAWQRTRRYQGRVGSLFDPGGAKSVELASRDEPPSEVDLQRERERDRADGVSDPEEVLDEQQLEDDSEREQYERRRQELRERELEDIEPEDEEELRNRQLDDINVRIIPVDPLSPQLR